MSGGREGAAGVGPVYLVVERDVLIARDLFETLMAHDHTCVVTIAADVEAGSREAQGQGRLDAAFVSARMRDLDESGLGALVEARGGRMVLLSGAEDSAAPGRGWTFLSRPYSERDILRVLDEIARSRTTAP